MVHRYRNEKSCPFCGAFTNDLFQLSDNTLVCKSCYDEEEEKSDWLDYPDADE